MIQLTGRAIRRKVQLISPAIDLLAWKADDSMEQMDSALI